MAIYPLPTHASSRQVLHMIVYVGWFGVVRGGVSKGDYWGLGWVCHVHISMLAVTVCYGFQHGSMICGGPCRGFYSR